MLVVGARGHAKEILQILVSRYTLSELRFFDNINPETLLYKQFKVIKSFNELSIFLKQYPDFVLGIGGPTNRKMLSTKLEELGGNLVSVISENALIGTFDVSLGKGLNIMNNVFISNSVEIGMGSLLNYGSNIHHDVKIGAFCEISPKVQVLGNVEIGDNCFVGAGATLLPKVKVGNNVIIGAGALVTKNIPDNVVVVGVPARSIRSIDIQPEQD
ncbi:acetyltransferase [Chitinophaga sp. RAB17]|uniref:acetyltransferase n=1 Tax=Chitinophaga sp. RAB17 TaxID=3233049 RepID=UPI003F92FA77